MTGSMTSLSDLLAQSSLRGAAPSPPRLAAAVRHLGDQDWQRQAWLAASAEITTALLSGNDPEEALGLVARRFRQITAATVAAILVPVEAGHLVVAVAETAEYVDPEHARVTGRVLDVAGAEPGGEMWRLGQAVRDGRAALISDGPTTILAGDGAGIPVGAAAVVPLVAASRSLGLLVIGTPPDAAQVTSLDLEMAKAFAGHAAFILEFARVQRDRERLAVFEDRDRIARDLHDVVLQRLFAVGLELHGLPRMVDAAVGERLSAAVSDLDLTIADIRHAIFSLASPTGEADARRIAAEAQDLRNRTLREADDLASGIVSTARAEAEHIVDEARSSATQLEDESQARLDELERQRDQVTAQLGALRDQLRPVAAPLETLPVGLEAEDTPKVHGHYQHDRLEAADSAALAGLGTPTHFGQGAELISQGTAPDSVLLLLRGRVKVVAFTDNGHESLLALRGPGDMVGEMEAVDGGTRSATVTAIEPVTAVVVPVPTFQKFLRDRPAAAAALLGMLVGRLRESDRPRAGFGAYGTAVRLARRLVDLADEHGLAHADGGIALHVGLTQHDLAASIGASRESVGQDLAMFREQGMVSRQRRPIVITDVQALRQFAHGERPASWTGTFPGLTVPAAESS